jgi:hypothetical protein
LQQEWRDRRGRRYDEEMNERGRNRAEARSPRAQYAQWLEDHRGNDVESEGERQLEGLQPQHRWHPSDRRSRSSEPSRQPRSQRRYDEPGRAPQGRDRSYESLSTREDRSRPRLSRTNSGRAASTRAVRPGNSPAGRRRSE